MNPSLVTTIFEILFKVLCYYLGNQFFAGFHYYVFHLVFIITDVPLEKDGPISCYHALKTDRVILKLENQL